MPGRRKCSTYRFTLCKFRSKRSRCRITNYLGCWRFRFSIWLDEVFKLCSGHLFTPTLRLIGNQQQVYVFNPISARRIYSLFQADKTERAARISFCSCFRLGSRNLLYPPSNKTIR